MRKTTHIAFGTICWTNRSGFRPFTEFTYPRLQPRDTTLLSFRLRKGIPASFLTEVNPQVICVPGLDDFPTKLTDSDMP